MAGFLQTEIVGLGGQAKPRLMRRLHRRRNSN
jgi:hypothetical protein